MKIDKLEYFTVEDTGWSESTSWFEASSKRFDYKVDAITLCKQLMVNSESDFRIVKHTIINDYDGFDIAEQTHKKQYTYMR